MLLNLLYVWQISYLVLAVILVGFPMLVISDLVVDHFKRKGK